MCANRPIATAARAQQIADEIARRPRFAVRKWTSHRGQGSSMTWTGYLAAPAGFRAAVIVLNTAQPLYNESATALAVAQTEDGATAYARMDGRENELAEMILADLIPA